MSWNSGALAATQGLTRTAEIHSSRGDCTYWRGRDTRHQRPVRHLQLDRGKWPTIAHIFHVEGTLSSQLQGIGTSLGSLGVALQLAVALRPFWEFQPRINLNISPRHHPTIPTFRQVIFVFMAGGELIYESTRITNFQQARQPMLI